MCSGLTSVEIPNLVTTIGGSAFWGFVVIPVDALELLQLLAHVHAARGWDVVG